MRELSYWWAFLLILAVWMGLVTAISLYLSGRNKHYLENIILVLSTIFAFAGLLTLIEWALLWYLLMIGCVSTTAMLFIFPVQKLYSVRYELKPWRRMIMMLWVFDLYAVTTILFAFSQFFPEVAFWLYAVVGSAVFSAVTMMIWKMYFEKSAKFFLLWLAIIDLVMLEVIWVAHFLPWGYLVLGFLVTWFWYVIQLLMRFNLTTQGIIWQKQRWFLATNVTLYLFFLIFVVRWI
jgi:hypothetical protein